jgi:hypothetical protein
MFATLNQVGLFLCTLKQVSRCFVGFKCHPLISVKQKAGAKKQNAVMAVMAVVLLVLKSECCKS